MSYPAIYRARATGRNGSVLDVFVPQIFGDVPIKVTDAVGGHVLGKGWVMFQGGDPSFPVWLSDALSGGDDGPDVPDIPPGGAAGQVLGKISAVDYDVDWVNQTGSGGGVGVVSFVFHQGTPAATWVINHNLGWYPGFTVVDSGGTQQEGDFVHNSANQLTLTFSGAFSGTAYLS